MVRNVLRADAAVRDSAMNVAEALFADPLSTVWPSGSYDGDNIEASRERLLYVQEQVNVINAAMATVWADFDRVTRGRL